MDLYLLRWILVEPGAHQFWPVWLASLPRECPVSVSQELGLQAAAMTAQSLHGAEDLTSGPHVCTARASSTAISPAHEESMDQPGRAISKNWLYTISNSVSKEHTVRMLATFFF